MPSIQALIDSSLQIPTKGRSQWGRHMKDGDPFGQLGLGIPASQYVKKDWEEGAFKKSDQEPERV